MRSSSSLALIWFTVVLALSTSFERHVAVEGGDWRGSSRHRAIKGSRPSAVRQQRALRRKSDSMNKHKLVKKSKHGDRLDSDSTEATTKESMDDPEQVEDDKGKGKAKDKDKNDKEEDESTEELDVESEDDDEPTKDQEMNDTGKGKANDKDDYNDKEEEDESAEELDVESEDEPANDKQDKGTGKEKNKDNDDEEEEEDDEPTEELDVQSEDDEETGGGTGKDKDDKPAKELDEESEEETNGEEDKADKEPIISESEEDEPVETLGEAPVQAPDSADDFVYEESKDGEMSKKDSKGDGKKSDKKDDEKDPEEDLHMDSNDGKEKDKSVEEEDESEDGKDKEKGDDSKEEEGESGNEKDKGDNVDYEESEDEMEQDAGKDDESVEEGGGGKGKDKEDDEEASVEEPAQAPVAAPEESEDEMVEAPVMAPGKVMEEESEDSGGKGDKSEGQGKGKGKGDDVDSADYEDLEFEGSEDEAFNMPKEESKDEVTDAPDRDPPTMAPVATDAPVVTDAPATDAPATDGPVTDGPATDIPDTDAPATDGPATDAPETSPPDGSLNDDCTSAVPILTKETVTGTTVDAEWSDVEECGSALGGDTAAPGLFYSISGTGSGLKAFVNSTFDMQVSVFLGPDCDSLSCIGGSAGSAFPWSSGELDWAAEDGEEYIIVVNGWDTEVGEFELTISEGDIPPNSACSTAIMVESGEEVEGTTEFGRVADVAPCPSGDVLSNVTSPTVWYSILGGGEYIQVSVFADFDTQLSIYTGDNCDILTCVGTNDDSPVPGPRSILAELLEDGVSYFILVHGFNSAAGQFTLAVETLDAAENDECIGATELPLGSSESGSTLAASSVDDLPFCGVGTNESSIGVWYSVAGTGGVLELSLNATLSLDMSVYAFDCDALVCVASNDRPLFPLDWDSVAGEQYFLYVYATNTDQKDTFEIKVDEISRPENDLCEDATPLEINGPVINGTTRASSTETDLDFCGEVVDVGFGGVWYSFTGNGGILLLGVNTADSGDLLQFDSQVTLYSGASCDELTCIDGNDEGARLGYASALAVESTEGESYYAFIHGYGISRGDFTIELLEVNRPLNDDCASAVSLEAGDTVAGATYFAQQTGDADFEMCGSSQGRNFSSPGVWYTVTGTGGLMGASISATYDVQLTVFAGGCSDLTCVDGTEGFTTDFFSGALYWQSEADIQYSVLVHGFSDQVGEFELFFAEVQRPANDVCAGAIGIEVGDRIMGSNQFASIDALPDCGLNSTQVAEAPGVWYSFSTDSIPPSEGVFSLSALLVEADFSHQITITTGESCDSLTCVAYDDSDAEAAFVEWLPQEGETYWISVSGYGEERGEFELALYAVENVA